GVAAGAREDEHDRGQQGGLVQQLHHVRSECGARGAGTASPGPAAPVAAASVAAAPVRALAAALALVGRPVLAGAAWAVPAAGAPAAAVSPAAGTAGALVDGQREGGDAFDLGIDLPVAAGTRAVGGHCLPVLVHEEVQQLLADDDVLPQRHRPRLGDDDLGAAAHLLQPGAELLGVRDG